MKLDDLILKCYAEKEPDGSWFVICLDLNLTGHKDTLKEAIESMNEKIKEYLYEAHTVDKKYLKDLIPRKAPYIFYLKYYLEKYKIFLRFKKKLKKSQQSQKSFEEPLLNLFCY